jgi:TusA-related sulfurtransferase
MTRTKILGWLAALVLVGSPLEAKPTQPDDDMTGQREMHMSNCPSAVPGAVTKLVDLDDGVELTITATSPWAQREIRARAQQQGVTSWAPEKGAIEHTGLGTGSGRYGYCPGMLEATTVDEELLPNGARLTVRADRPAQVRELQRTTHARLKALQKRRLPTS